MCSCHLVQVCSVSIDSPAHASSAARLIESVSMLALMGMPVLLAGATTLARDGRYACKRAESMVIVFGLYRHVRLLAEAVHASGSY